MHIEFVGNHYTAYRGGGEPTDNYHNWSSVPIDFGTRRPNPFEYNANNFYSSTVIVSDNDCILTEITFTILSENDGKYIETDQVYKASISNKTIEYSNSLYVTFDTNVGGTLGCCGCYIKSKPDFHGLKISVKTSADTQPPTPPAEHLVFPNGVPTGYTLHTTDGTNMGDIIDVSQLKAVSGTTFPSFGLLKDEDHYTYEDSGGFTLPEININGTDTLTADEFYDYTVGSGYIFNNTSKKYVSADFQPVISDLPKATPTGATLRTVTLNRSFCTADKEDSNSIEDGSAFTVNFTANSGYIFKVAPYYNSGSNKIEGEITDSTHAIITINSVTSDIEIIAACEKSEPTPDTGLAFTHVYNPTFSQLKEAANTLFTNTATGETINLQQYVISVHKLFVPVPTNENSETIRFWKYDTGVASKVINQTKVKVSCGKVSIPEKWNNALDYSPYTTVRIWLPFLGFYDLSIDELMNDEIELTYTIDILSGKALAEIWHNDKVIYRFVGTAKVDEPYYVESGHNTSQAYINGAYNMADFTPYLLLDRPQNLTPSNTSLHGQPTYRITTISECSGYIRCSQVFASGMTATDEEKQEIESLLKSGVLVD